MKFGFLMPKYALFSIFVMNGAFFSFFLNFIYLFYLFTRRYWWCNLHAGNGGVIYTQVMWCNLYINLLFFCAIVSQKSDQGRSRRKLEGDINASFALVYEVRVITYAVWDVLPIKFRFP